jgi:uncharacterized protein
MQLKVPFSEIPEQGVEYEITDSSWFPVERMEQAGPAVVHVRLTKKSDNRIELKGNLQAGVVLECDRCLERFVFQVDSPLQLVVEVADSNEHWRLHDLELAEEELEIVSQEEPVIDLVDILRQQLYLSLPEKRLCTEKCSGLCRICGNNLNKGECGCTRETTDSPFAVLGKLKKNN